MKIAKLAWANIRKSKSATASLLLLIVIASLLLSTGISIFLKMSTFYDDKVEQLHDPHISILMDRAKYDPAFERFFKDNAAVVKETEAESMILLSKVNYWFGDSETTDAAAIVNANESRTIAPFKLAEKLEDGAGEDGLLTEVIEGEGERQKITAKAIKARLKDIGRDPDLADEREALTAYQALIDAFDETKKKRKAAEEKLTAKVHARYAAVTDDEVKTLVVADKWLATISERVDREVARVAQALTTRVRALAERYERSLPKLEEDVEVLAARVAGHLKAMGGAWN